MKQYHDLLMHVLKHGEDTVDRTGVGTRSIFGHQMRFDLQEGFPAITTKRLAWKAVVGELLWFLEGSTDERRLAELTYGKDRTELVDKQTIWTANADCQGKELGYFNNDFTKQLGPVYGSQWRKFGEIQNKDSAFIEYKGVDQVKRLINIIKTNPGSRRLILSAWNPNQIHEMALPPCHYSSLFNIKNNKLSCLLNLRSNDLLLGAPFNIASYALLTHILAKECNLEVGELVYSIGDAHIYLNHIEHVKEQLSRQEYALPTLEINDSFNLNQGLDYEFELNAVDKFTLKNYRHHPTIKAPMAI